MPWVVDTCVVLDLALNDPQYGISSAECLERHLPEGLVICPVTFVELAPQFGGDLSGERRFLRHCGIDCYEAWDLEDTERAAKAFSVYIELKRKGQVAKRPVADILIGAFAARHRGIITRNQADFVPYFPDLAIVVVAV